jgi:Tol biopolymer transport system component
MLFASDQSGSLGSTDIWISKRSSRSAAWGAPANVSELNSAAQETSPVMTPDGLRIVMTSARVSGGPDVFTGVRASASEPWMPIVEQTALNTAGHEGSPFLTADGLTVYFDTDRDGTLDIYMSTRASVTDPFPPAVPLTEINTAAGEEDPWVSPDGHHLFFYSTRDGIPGLWESSR